MTDRILVTGAAGFVGKHLVETLATDHDVEIVASDIAESPPKRYAGLVGDGLIYRTGDITEESFLDDLLADNFDRIYHLAAVVGVGEYVKNPLRLTDVNIIATRNILDRVRDEDVRFVFASTSEVYGKNSDVPWAEHDDRVLGPPTIDRWSYSTSKSACEHMIHALGQTETPFTSTVVRPFNLYGPGQRPDFVIPAFVEAVVNDTVPTVFGDGRQTRCFTYINDFIQGLIRASTDEAGENELFNLGSTREVEIRELATLVLRLSDHEDRSPEYVDPTEVYGDSYEDLVRRVPDVSKAERLLGWSAEMPLERGIQNVLEWGEENYT